MISQGIPYATVTGALDDYVAIIFNNYTPGDLAFDVTIAGTEHHITILSSSFFESEAASALAIVKNFVAIVIGYYWLLAMRKKTSHTLG